MVKKKDDELVTVIVPTYNREHSIKKCVDALVAQTYKNLEFIISDDCSTDNTAKIIRGYKGKVKLVQTQVNGGPSAARNLAIHKAQGRIIFFTDDDVVVPRDWVEKGIKYFEDRRAVGIEGKIIYVDEAYKARFGDRLVENTRGGLYMTANAAYRKECLLEVGSFDTSYLHYQDRDLALRLMRLGSIIYADNVVVRHQQERYTTKSYMAEAEKILYNVKLVKEHNDRMLMVGPFFQPSKLLVMLFPPLIIVRVFMSRFDNADDWALLPLLYLRIWYERILLWECAIKTRIFVI